MTAIALAVAAMGAAMPARAQYIDGRSGQKIEAPPAGTIESPADKLARALRNLAVDPKDFFSLIEAGRASLLDGDIASAAGFFGRAEELNPKSPFPKIGMGGASALAGDTAAALGWFARAQALGATVQYFGLDRGLAYDLIGDTARAQADYRVALGGDEPNEARRRLALSTAIDGRMDEALKILEPLLVRRDPSAQRVRAFVLALGGLDQMAQQALDQLMPGAGARIGPYFRDLRSLSAPQKARAVHLGVFPTAEEVRLSRSGKAGGETARPVRLASETARAANAPKGGKVTIIRTPTPPPPGQPDPLGPAAAAVTVAPTPIPAAAAPAPTPASTEAEPVLLADVGASLAPTPSAATPATAAIAGSADNAVPPAPTPFVDPPPAPQPVVESEERASGIDRLIAVAAPVESAKAKREAAAREAARKAADRKAKEAAAKAAADRKAKEEAAKLGVAGTYWVQVAGGSNRAGLAGEFARLQKKSAVLRREDGFASEGRDFHRLLVGPYPTAEAAQAMVARLKTSGIDSFRWTRSPAQIKIERLSR